MQVPSPGSSFSSCPLLSQAKEAGAGLQQKALASHLACKSLKK